MHHFFINPEHIQKPVVNFSSEISHQIRHVLRLTAGDRVGVLDNSGTLYTVVLNSFMSDQRLTGKIVSEQALLTEPEVKLGLFFALSNREKVEWILQKATEIGVASFYPYVSSRALVTSLSLTEKKQARWEKIIQEAAEQSGRGKLPVLNPPGLWLDCLDKASSTYALGLIAWEGVGAGRYALAEKIAAFKGKSIALFVGPEGGLSEDEVSAAIEAGCQVVSLGTRTLRMETAALVFPALVLYQLEMM